MVVQKWFVFCRHQNAMKLSQKYLCLIAVGSVSIRTYCWNMSVKVLPSTCGLARPGTVCSGFLHCSRFFRSCRRKKRNTTCRAHSTVSTRFCAPLIRMVCSFCRRLRCDRGVRRCGGCVAHRSIQLRCGEGRRGCLAPPPDAPDSLVVVVRRDQRGSLA